jgi:two-component system, chemotaxis family, chemotaxis protein CheY
MNRPVRDRVERNNICRGVAVRNNVEKYVSRYVRFTIVLGPYYHMRVLIVDDSKAMRMLVVRAMRQAGYEADVVEASNGVEALASLETGRFDLILSDWNMPEMDGLEFLRTVRGNGAHTPFVFITTEWTPERRVDAEQSGANGLLSKPFTGDSMRAVLGPIL